MRISAYYEAVFEVGGKEEEGKCATLARHGVLMEIYSHG